MNALTDGPDGYCKLPKGVKCKCLKLWRTLDGALWCCQAFERFQEEPNEVNNAWAVTSQTQNTEAT